MKLCLLVSLIAGALLAAPTAHAQDAAADVAKAESDAAAAESEISAAQSEVATAQSTLEPVAKRAAAAGARAEEALSEVESIESDLIDRRVEAAEKVAALETDYAAEVAENDEQGETNIGFGIASLVLAAIALFWTRFRASAPMVWLARRPTFKALAIIGGGVLAGFLVGAGLMDGDGLARALEPLRALLALGLGVAAPIARHSLRVEQGSCQPLFSRERLPRWIALVVAVILALLFVGGLGQRPVG